MTVKFEISCRVSYTGIQHSIKEKKISGLLHFEATTALR